MPESEVAEVIDCYPSQCESCWIALPQRPEPKPKCYQVTEIPPLKQHVIEYRCHRVRCECGYQTEGQLPPGVAKSAFGPCLTGLVGLLTGYYHLSRRDTMTLLRDAFDVQISLGAVSAMENRVSEALKPAVEEAWNSLSEAPVTHTDGTSWQQSGAPLAVWTLATPLRAHRAKRLSGETTSATSRA